MFFLREKMKALTHTTADPVGHVHVVGAGAMGADIAGWCAFQGLRVTLFDMDADRLAEAVKKLADLCEKKHRSESQRRDILDRLTPDFANRGVENADLVIEAVPEQVDIKQKVYEDVEPRLKKVAILATNTSSIPLETPGEKLRDSKRLVGLHFFNPVALDICLSVADMLRDRLDTDMPPAPDWLRQKVEDGKLGKKSGEGLYQWEKGKADKQDDTAAAPDDTLDRLLLPMLNACMACLREGVIDSESLVDGAMIFGTGFAPFRGGPMNYAHKRGFDNIRQSLETLVANHGDRFRPDEGWSAGS